MKDRCEICGKETNYLLRKCSECGKSICDMCATSDPYGLTICKSCASKKDWENASRQYREKWRS